MRRTPFFQKPLPYAYYYATIILIVLNALVFILRYLAPHFFNNYMSLDPETGANYFGLITNPALLLQRPWTLVSYLFMHADEMHIIFNMISLLIFGLAVEKKLGSNEFLLLYFFCGIFDGLLLVFLYPLLGLDSQMVIGASGAIFAVMLAYATFFPYSTLLIWGIIPVKAYVLVLILLGFSILAPLVLFFFPFIAPALGMIGNVSHLGHLAGALFGFLYLLVRLRVNPVKEIIYTRRYYQ
jgi:membrane associated rhomboid family serine protease